MVRNLLTAAGHDVAVDDVSRDFQAVHLPRVAAEQLDEILAGRVFLGNHPQIPVILSGRKAGRAQRIAEILMIMV